MCGIVAYVGTKKDTNFLIEKLKKLEYRGYDSAGLASLMNNRFEVYKEIGKIVNLEQKLEKNSILECAISHTRWATNGKVNVVNSHPHLSKDGNWAIVHNGIIENYAELKSHLKLMPDSDTDTAVVAEGLDEMNAHSIFDFINYFKKVSGGFAIVAINKHCPKTLFLAKRKNPLYVSENESGDFMVASDPICFDKFSKTYYLLEDDEFAKIEDKKIVFYNKNKTPINKDKIMLT